MSTSSRISTNAVSSIGGAQDKRASSGSNQLTYSLLIVKLLGLLIEIAIANLGS